MYTIREIIGSREVVLCHIRDFKPKSKTGWGSIPLSLDVYICESNDDTYIIHEGVREKMILLIFGYNLSFLRYLTDESSKTFFLDIQNLNFGYQKHR